MREQDRESRREDNDNIEVNCQLEPASRKAIRESRASLNHLTRLHPFRQWEISVVLLFIFHPTAGVRIVSLLVASLRSGWDMIYEPHMPKISI